MCMKASLGVAKLNMCGISLLGVVGLKTQSWVVAFNVSFRFFKPIPHFLAKNSGVTKWCLLFVILTYPFLVIYTLMFPTSLSTMRSWDNLNETFNITLSNSWMFMSSCIYVTGVAQVFWLLTWLIDLRLNMLLFWYSHIEDILKMCFDGSQLCSF